MSANQLDNNALAQLSEVKGSLDSIMKPAARESRVDAPADR